MSAALSNSDGPMAGARTARLGQVWEAANALAAAQVPKQFNGSIKRSDISVEPSNSIDCCSPIRLRRLVEPAVSGTWPSRRLTRSKLVATLCLIAVILIGSTSDIIAFRQFPLTSIWSDYIPSWTQLHRPTSTMSQQASSRLRVESSRGIPGEPIKLGLAVEGPAKSAVVIITAMLAGMEISTGTKIGADRWELVPDALPYAFVAPPEKFVGSVNLIAELRLADDEIVDRQTIYLEWGPSSSPVFAESQYNRKEPPGPNPGVASVSDREKTAGLSSAGSSAADGIARQEAMVLSTRPADSDPVRDTTAAISSSASPSPELQDAMVSSSPPVERNPDREKTAAIASSSAPAPERQEAAALSSTLAVSNPEREKTEQASSSIPPAAFGVDRQEATATTLAVSDPERETTVEASSSTPPVADRVDRHEAPVSPPVTAAQLKKSVVRSAPSLEQDPVGRQEAMQPTFPRDAQKQIDQNQPVRQSGPPAVAQRQLDTEEIAVLLQRGKDLIAQGDIAGARVTLKRAAEANHAEAALALASTYDPFVLRELKVYGFSADAAMARAWYERAKELGSAVAPRRLEMLAREAR